jgi:predicted RNA-binding Zn ribbon-like protein
VHLDSYTDTGVLVAVDLVNELTRADQARADRKGWNRSALAQILAVDPPSLSQLRPADGPGFRALARALSQVFADFHRGDVDAAAGALNELLSKQPAHPHLAKGQGRWRLHHHPMAMALVPMWTAICAEAVARMLGAGHADRFGTCEAPDCDRVYFDVSKNASRRFCSTTCQNRVKAAAFRHRRSAPSGPRGEQALAPLARFGRRRA